MARRKYVEEHENHERWLISYADFITLLFAFFVVMYAISVVNEAKYKVFAESLGKALSGRGAVEVSVPSTSVTPPQPSVSLSTLVQRRRAEALRREKEVMRRLATKLSDTLAPMVKEGKVRVTQSSRGVSVEINASVLFDPGDATLARESDQALRALAVLLRDDPHAIQVEGHTDTMPIASGLFQSNWELSAVRASAVIRLFNDSGVAAGRLTAVGHAANVPAASNDTQEGRARNRRVTVMILSALPDNATEIPTR